MYSSRFKLQLLYRQRRYGKDGQRPARSKTYTEIFNIEIKIFLCMNKRLDLRRGSRPFASAGPDLLGFPDRAAVWRFAVVYGTENPHVQRFMRGKTVNALG
jgi:hypothetical protein